MGVIYFFVLIFLMFGCYGKGNVSSYKNLRDPFFLPAPQRNTKKVTDFVFCGVVKVGKKIGALIECNQSEQKLIFKGDKLNGYVIASISFETITFKKGKKKIVIPLKEG